MSTPHKDLSPFRWTAIRLEMLLDCVQNSCKNDLMARTKDVSVDRKVYQLDLIQKDQCQFALQLLQQLRSQLANHSYSSLQEKEQDEALLQSLTLQVQQFLNTLKPSIKDSIVQPKPTSIRIQDILSHIPIKHEKKNLVSSTYTKSTTHTVETSSLHESTTMGTTTTPKPASEKNHRTRIQQPDTSSGSQDIEPEVVSHHLQEEISQMAQVLKNSTLSIHSSLKHQNAQLNDMESLAQQSIDKTKAVSDKVHDHVRKGWKQTFGRWFMFFIIVGSWMFCFLVIKTIPKRPYRYPHMYREDGQISSSDKIQKARKSKDCSLGWLCTFQSLQNWIGTRIDDSGNDSPASSNNDLSKSYSTSCSKPSTPSVESDSFSSCSSPHSLNENTYTSIEEESETFLHKTQQHEDNVPDQHQSKEKRVENGMDESKIHNRMDSFEAKNKIQTDLTEQGNQDIQNINKSHDEREESYMDMRVIHDEQMNESAGKYADLSNATEPNIQNKNPTDMDDENVISDAMIGSASKYEALSSQTAPHGEDIHHTDVERGENGSVMNDVMDESEGNHQALLNGREPNGEEIQHNYENDDEREEKESVINHVMDGSADKYETLSSGIEPVAIDESLTKATEESGEQIDAGRSLLGEEDQGGDQVYDEIHGGREEGNIDESIVIDGSIANDEAVLDKTDQTRGDFYDEREESDIDGSGIDDITGRSVANDEAFSEGEEHGGENEIDDEETATFTHRDVLLAAATGDFNSLRYFIKHRPDYLLVEDENGWLPLHEAIRLGSTEIVSMILDAISTRDQIEMCSGVRGKVGSAVSFVYSFHNEHQPVTKYIQEKCDVKEEL